MKVVLASLDREDENLTAEPLWNQLKEVGAVEAYTKDAILAASRIRNKRAGHGSGAIPRAIGVAEATLCVSCAASAIAFLATRLNA